jgi:hypothetical protein
VIELLLEDGGLVEGHFVFLFARLGLLATRRENAPESLSCILQNG